MEQFIEYIEEILDKAVAYPEYARDYYKEAFGAVRWEFRRTGNEEILDMWNNGWSDEFIRLAYGH